MNSEKMAVLQMLADKEISAEEAARLLQGIGKTSGGSARVLTPPDDSFAFSGTISKAKPPAAPEPPEKPEETKKEPPKKEAPRQESPGANRNTSAGGESFAEELSRKFGTLVRDMEPKLQKLTEVVVGKTVGAANAFARSVSTPAPVERTPAGARGGTERMFELKITEPNGELNLAGLNGPVLVKGYNGDKISAKIYYVPKTACARLELLTLGSKVFLDYDENDFRSVHIDAFVPEKMFANIRLSSVNGSLTASTLTASNIRLEALNGDLDMNGLAADNIIAEGNNCPLRLRDITAARASVENFNNSIAASNADIAQLQMTTFNASVTLQMAAFRRYADYAWDVESSNGKVRLILPSSESIGYDIKAAASLGSVKLGMLGLRYIRNDRACAEAQSEHFERAAKKIRLKLQTSNAVLEVN